MSFPIPQDEIQHILPYSAPAKLCKCHLAGAYCEVHGEYHPVPATVIPPRSYTTGGGRRVHYKRLTE